MTPRISPAGVLVSAFALAAIGATTAAHASFGHAVQIHGNRADGRTSTLFTIPEVHKPKGLAFGNGPARQAVPDRVPLLSFTINHIGPVDEESEIMPADGMAFDRSGNFYIAHFSAKTVVKFAASGPIDVFAASEFAPLPGFLPVELGEGPGLIVGFKPEGPDAKSQVGPIPEPGGTGLLTAVALLGVGVSRRFRAVAK